MNLKKMSLLNLLKAFLYAFIDIDSVSVNIEKSLKIDCTCQMTTPYHITHNEKNSKFLTNELVIFNHLIFLR